MIVEIKKMNGFGESKTILRTNLRWEDQIPGLIEKIRPRADGRWMVVTVRTKTATTIADAYTAEDVEAFLKRMFERTCAAVR